MIYRVKSNPNFGQNVHLATRKETIKLVPFIRIRPGCNKVEQTYGFPPDRQVQIMINVKFNLTIVIYHYSEKMHGIYC